MREKLFKIIDVSTENNSLSHGYDSFMMIVIIVSLVPLAFKTTNTVFLIIEYVSTFVFIIDYLLRLITADFKTGLKHPAAAIVYPFTPMAAIDLLVILSSFSFLSNGFRVLKVLRLMRSLRLFRAAKILRYSKSLVIIMNVLKKEKQALSAVATLAIAYIIISALVIRVLDYQLTVSHIVSLGLEVAVAVLFVSCYFKVSITVELCNILLKVV